MEIRIQSTMSIFRSHEFVQDKPGRQQGHYNPENDRENLSHVEHFNASLQYTEQRGIRRCLTIGWRLD
jgi:hypothetical protein